jgi:hypothetical protein
MKKLTVALMVVSLMVAGVALAATATQPQVLKGVDLKSAQPVSDTQAQSVRGAAKGTPTNPNPGTCMCTTTTCTPNLYLSPGPHKK